jgi:hypothetical protein
MFDRLGDGGYAVPTQERLDDFNVGNLGYRSAAATSLHPNVTAILRLLALVLPYPGWPGTHAPNG